MPWISLKTIKWVYTEIDSSSQYKQTNLLIDA